MKNLLVFMTISNNSLRQELIIKHIRAFGIRNINFRLKFSLIQRKSTLYLTIPPAYGSTN